MRFVVALVVLAAVLWAAPARAEGAPPAGDDVAERLRRLEALLEQQAEEIRRLRAEVDAGRGAPPSTGRVAASTSAEEAPAGAPPPEPPVPPGPPPLPGMPPPPAQPVLVGTSGGGGGGARVGGYLTAEYVAPSDDESYFDLHRLIVSLDAAITDRIDFTAEIEFEHGGVHPQLDGEIHIERAEVSFLLCDALVPKAGVLLIPFGRWNLYHDDPLNDFTMRPFVGRYLVPSGFGQPGLGVEGVLPFGCGHLLSYNLALTQGYEDDFSASRGVRNSRQPWQQDNNEDKQLWGRVAATFETRFLSHLEVGASGTWARYDDEGRNDLLGWGLDAVLRKGPFEVKAEVLGYDIERDAADPVGAVEGQTGWLVEAAWHFMPPAWRCCRSALVTETSHFTLAGRWQAMDLDDLRRGATFEDDLQAWSVALNYRVTEATVLRADMTWFDALRAPDETEFTVSLSTYF